MSRDELIAHARELSINRPELMTRVELRDEIVRLSETDEELRKRARGWLGVARDLVASVVEQRLNLPDAAEMIRGANLRVPRHVPPVATVTLAEIYAAQGHLPRAIKLLDEVLMREPDHAAAEALRATLIEQQAALASETPDTLSSIIPEPEAWVNSSPPPDATASWPGEPADGLNASDATGAAADPVLAVAEAHAPGVGLAQVTATEGKLEADEVVAEIPPSAATAAEPAVDVATPITSQSIQSPVVTEAAKSESAKPSASVVDPSPMVAEMEAVSSASLSTGLPDLLSEVLLYRRSEATVVCHWWLNVDTWESRQAHRDGQWVVRVFQVKAAAGPLESEEVDIELPGTSGEILLNDIEASQHVRMAIGWKVASNFTPVVIGVEVAGEVPEQLSIAWSPLPSVADPPADLWLDHARRSWHALSMGIVP